MKNNTFLYIGTYTKEQSEGIYVYRVTETGQLQPVTVSREENPSYLAFHPTLAVAYSITESDQGHATAWQIDPNEGHLSLINREATGGAAPCNILIDRKGRFAVTSDYGGGTLTVFPLDPEGRLLPFSQHLRFSGKSIDPLRQDAPHIHCARFSPDGAYLLVTDLGTDRIHRFRLSDTGDGKFLDEGSRMDFDLPAGSGPRHMIFSVDGHFLYLVNELSSTVMTFEYHKNQPRLIQTLDYPDQQGSGADIRMTPDGKHLYTSFRDKNDGVSVFRIHPDTGLLEKIQYQPTVKHPRNLCISPKGHYLLAAGRDSDAVQIFRLDAQTGIPQDTGQQLSVSQPVFVGFRVFS